MQACIRHSMQNAGRNSFNVLHFVAAITLLLCTLKCDMQHMRLQNHMKHRMHVCTFTACVFGKSAMPGLETHFTCD